MEQQKTINAQLSQRICTVESSLNKKSDVLQSDLDHKFDHLQYSISRLTNQHVHPEEESPEEECLSDTMVEGSGKEVAEDPKKLILQPIPINLDPSATVQPKNNPLPVHILPTHAPHATPETPTAKAIPSPLPMLQNFRKLVPFFQTFATTSHTLAAAHIAWHNGWFGCWFKFGALEPQQLHQLHQF